ncbi:glycoside hydrolase family 125 protein [Backusella circina FSU 941]|nr:glycoside hydrolase family 125 protein [Backusella circina FSU 941]
MSNCPDYTQYARQSHLPLSNGPLGLPFQRPIESCRKFTSQVIESIIHNVTSRITNMDLARLFENSFPNTLDTTIKSTICTTSDQVCRPLTYIITGDINAMWLRDSANQILPYLDYIKHDVSLKKLFLGTIYMQAQFINIDPYANAFNEPNMNDAVQRRSVNLKSGVFEAKWEIDSLASFMGLSYRYWNTTGDNSFVQDDVWVNAIESILTTVKQEQDPTFNKTTGEILDVKYRFFQEADRPTETQFLNGRGQPVKYTGMVKSLFRPSDDATVFPFFVPGNAMLSVELGHLSELLTKSNNGGSARTQRLASEASRIASEIRNGIYKYAIVDHPQHGKIFAYEVDGYGSTLLIDDANVPSLLSLSYLGFVNQDDPIYQSTRKMVLSLDNPYYFTGSRGSGIGGPHIGLGYAWPMSQIVRILTSSSDDEIKEALDLILHSTDGTGLIHESLNVFEKRGGDNNLGYTRSWFAWANALFGQTILKIAAERPHLIFSK